MHYIILFINYSAVPEDINQMDMLQHLDIRFNKIKKDLPSSMLTLRNLMRLNVRGNRITGLDTAKLPLLETLNCSEAALRSLAIMEGPIKSLIAKTNSQFVLICRDIQLVPSRFYKSNVVPKE